MGRFGRVRQFAPIAAMAIVVALARTAAAGAPPTALEGNHPDQAAEIVGAANATAAQPLAMRLTLALHSRNDLDRLLADQQDLTSPDYHRWLTPDEFTNRFGPSAADLKRVTDWLKRKGFAVGSADASTREVWFTGTVAQAERAFAVKIIASADGRWYSNTIDPVVPAGIAPLVESIHGLDNLLHSQPLARRVSSVPATIVNGTGPAFGPSDIYAFYDETPLLNHIDGSGAGCIAVIEDSNIDLPAANAFNAQFGLPPLSTPTNFNLVLVNHHDPGLNQDQDETMVDVSYSHAVAPGASIKIYLGDQSHSRGLAILDALHAAITDKNSLCTAISVSFSLCGGSKGFYKTQGGFFAQAAAQGQSVLVATGDNGAAGLKLDQSNGGCVVGTSRSVNELATSPNVTAIGGTEFRPDFVDGNDSGFVAESVWDDGDGAAGGGQSKVFRKPAFQKGLIAKDKNRDVPDISFGASPATPGFFFGGKNKGAPAILCCIGGTSIGAPAWAGISELISQAHGAPIGNLNARIYQLGAMADGATTGIRDVTSGANSFNGVAGFSASPGYDKASGWGTVDMGVFVPAFVGP